jgi:hypothetical protein
MVPELGAGAATGAGAAAVCAMTGTPQAPRIVPTRSIRPARLILVLLLEMTRPRLDCGAAPLRVARFTSFTPLPQAL